MPIVMTESRPSELPCGTRRGFPLLAQHPIAGAPVILT